jgi:hypothetical protein
MMQHVPGEVVDLSMRLIITALSLLPGLALAANSNLYHVRLKNGDVLSGELKSSSATALVLHTPYAGDVKIKRSEVQAFSPLRPSNEQASTATHAAAASAPVKPWSLQLDISAATRAGKEQAKKLQPDRTL